MIDWLMLLAGGFLGSSHCIGMCGGFALALGTTRASLWRNLGRQITYSLGRVFTYTAGGAMAGYVGLRLLDAFQQIVNVQAGLALAAGFLLIAQGLAAAGALRLPPLGSGKSFCLGPHFFAALLHAPGPGHVFAAGVLNGFLPCGLVYAYLALAGSTSNLAAGALTMALFGLGTVPVMVLVGCGGTVMRLTLRRRLVRVAAWCVVVTGVISIARGLGYMPATGFLQPASCPLCHP